MFHASDNGGIDGVIFPTLRSANLDTIKKIFKYVLSLMKDSARTYNGSRKSFVGYFLLQPYVGDYVQDLVAVNDQGISIDYIGLTKTAGITFHKIQIQIDKSAL